MHTPLSVWIVIDKYTIKTLKKKKTFRKHLRFRELSLNCTFSFPLYSFLEINTNKYLKWTGKPKFRLRNLGKQIDWFICLLPGHIMTSTVKIQLVRLLAPLTSFNRKSSKLQQDAGYPLKTILLRWLFMDALN